MPFAAGSQNIEASLSNNGGTVLTSATIKWSLDGGLQSSYSWIGSLAVGGTESNIVISNYNFSAGIVQTLRIWVENPNGGIDLNSANDDISEDISASLCGTYTLGGTNPDFASFSELSTILNNAGITCPVTINVRDGIYNEQFILSNVTGNSFANTITIQGESGDSSLAQIYWASNNFDNNVISFSNIKGITIKDLYLRHNSRYNYSNITDCDSVLFTNCILDQLQLQFNSSTGVSLKNNYFKNNYGYPSVVFNDNADNNEQLSINITNNVIGDPTSTSYGYIQISKNYSNSFKVLIDARTTRS